MAMMVRHLLLRKHLLDHLHLAHELQRAVNVATCRVCSALRPTGRQRQIPTSLIIMVLSLNTMSLRKHLLDHLHLTHELQCSINVSTGRVCYALYA
jgi:hypothetical protein